MGGVVVVVMVVVVVRGVLQACAQKIFVQLFSSQASSRLANVLMPLRVMFKLLVVV